MRIATLLLLLSSPHIAAEPKVHRDIAYAEPKNERQTLDVYASTDGKARPLIFWIHGGAWKAGNKNGVQKKPQVFVGKGFIFVATNYRFVPNVTVKEMAGDIAKAIQALRDYQTGPGGDRLSAGHLGNQRRNAAWNCPK